MSISEQEVSAQCPYCFSPITFLCEFLEGPQSYIEDCEVCCKPIQISFLADAELGITDFLARRLDE